MARGYSRNPSNHGSRIRGTKKDEIIRLYRSGKYGSYREIAEEVRTSVGYVKQVIWGYKHNRGGVRGGRWYRSLQVHGIYFQFRWSRKNYEVLDVREDPRNHGKLVRGRHFTALFYSNGTVMVYLNKGYDCKGLGEFVKWISKRFPARLVVRLLWTVRTRGWTEFLRKLSDKKCRKCLIKRVGNLIWARVDRSPYPTTLEIGVSEELRRLIAKANQVESLKS